MSRSFGVALIKLKAPRCAFNKPKALKLTLVAAVTKQLHSKANSKQRNRGSLHLLFDCIKEATLLKRYDPVVE